MIKEWFKSGSPWIWFTAAAVSINIIMVLGLLMLIMARGMSHFWPADVARVTYGQNGQQSFLGEQTDREQVNAALVRAQGIELDESLGEVHRILLKTGNRDVTGRDFNWLLEPLIEKTDYPENALVIERLEWGNFYGFPRKLISAGEPVAENDDVLKVLDQYLERASELSGELRSLELGDIGAINYQLERLRLERRGLELNNVFDDEAQKEIEQKESALKTRYKDLEKQMLDLKKQLARDTLIVATVDGVEKELSLARVVLIYQPNAMSLIDKSIFYLHKFWEFVSDEPREANTEGGIFPAIFGTVVMVIVMSIMVTPFGVVAAVYLREYARQGLLVRIIRIAVNNLAGVPSIVYGVFGLGFFVYAIGGSLDQLFFPEALPSPTLGTGGLLWASLTLAILTLPVVIVSTEEGLSRIPKAIREGSLALGATKAETLWRTVLPMASPAMMTGVILAVARAAGEVAPLMLVGVVKLAPSLPLDLNYPFIHPERKFMHLGFHIYDVGFQSPNVEAARPLVYATAFLLVVVIVLLNLLAIRIRNRLREKYRALEH